jgi:hypothetical protein
MLHSYCHAFIFKLMYALELGFKYNPFEFDQVSFELENLENNKVFIKFPGFMGSKSCAAQPASPFRSSHRPADSPMAQLAAAHTSEKDTAETRTHEERRRADHASPSLRLVL